jgi:outer membrane lipoprotein-sorting protein
MSLFTKIFILIISGILLCPGLIIAQQTLLAKEIVDKADKNMEGESSASTMSMSIIRPGWERNLEFKNWVMGSEYALTLVTAPSKEKGQAFLKRGNDMWNYIPRIGRLIKLPPSMMSQGWMGSDYSNDDVLKESSMVDDYDHTIVGEEIIEGKNCYNINMIPHEESTIVWGKLVTWVSKDDFLFLKTEYFDEDGYLVRTELGKEIKMMDGRMIPTILEIIPADEPDHKTVVHITTMEFNVHIKESFFSQQNMKNIR